MAKSLGIGFSSGSIYFTELIKESGAPKLNHIESVRVDFDFEDEMSRHKSSQKELTNISGEIQNYIKRRAQDISSVSVSIGTSQAFLITLPIDFSDGKQSINSKIYWELSNYYPENYNDFVINTYRLNNVLPGKDSDDFLIIAVPKNTIEFVKRIFKLCNIELSLIDIDHFSAEHSLRKCYEPLLEGKNVLLIGIKKGRIDFGVIENKKYKAYAYSKYNNEVEVNLLLTRKISSMLGLTTSSAYGMDAIFVYGDDIKDENIETLRRLNIAPVRIINPFEAVSASDLFLKDENLRKNSYKFTASCGVALRNFQHS